MLGLSVFTLHPLPLPEGEMWAVASGRLLELRSGWMNSVSRTWRIFLRGKLSGGVDGVGNAGGAGTDILVASSLENLLLLIKWRGLREGDTAAIVRRWGVASNQWPVRDLANVRQAKVCMQLYVEKAAFTVLLFSRVYFLVTQQTGAARYKGGATTRDLYVF